MYSPIFQSIYEWVEATVEENGEGRESVKATVKVDLVAKVGEQKQPLSSRPTEDKHTGHDS